VAPSYRRIINSNKEIVDTRHCPRSVLAGLDGIDTVVSAVTFITVVYISDAPYRAYWVKSWRYPLDRKYIKRIAAPPDEDRATVTVSMLGKLSDVRLRLWSLRLWTCKQTDKQTYVHAHSDFSTYSLTETLSVLFLLSWHCTGLINLYLTDGGGSWSDLYYLHQSKNRIDWLIDMFIIIRSLSGKVTIF